MLLSYVWQNEANNDAALWQNEANDAAASWFGRTKPTVLPRHGLAERSQQ